MESKYTNKLIDRHCDTIQKLIDEMNVNNYSFFYKDLETLSHLVTLLFKRINEDFVFFDLKKDVFIDLLIDLIKICNKPFLKEKISDELNYVPKTVFLLNSICDILQSDVIKKENLFILYIECISFIHDFVSYGVDEYKNQESDLQMKKMYGINFSLLNTLQNEGTRNLRLVSNSNVLETLVFILTNNSNDDKYIIIVINSLLNCALFKNNAEKLSNLGVLKDLVQIISDSSDFRSLLVRVSIEAIWNILENGGPNASRMMAFEV